MFRILIHKKALKEIERLPAEDRQRILTAGRGRKLLEKIVKPEQAV